MNSCLQLKFAVSTRGKNSPLCASGPILEAGPERVSSETLDRSWNPCSSQKGQAKLCSIDHREVPVARGGPELF